MPPYWLLGVNWNIALGQLGINSYWSKVQGKHNEELRKNEKCLELPDLARKFIRKSFIKFCPPPPRYDPWGAGGDV